MTDSELLESLQILEGMRKRLEIIIVKVQDDLNDQNTIRTIILSYFNISNDTFMSERRERDDNIYPRFFYAFFAKSLLGLSLARIADNTGKKNHSTILHGISTICNLIKTHNKEVTGHYEHLLLIMEERGYERRKVTDYLSGKGKR